MFSIKYRIPIILVLIGVTIFFGIGLTKMEKESGIEALIPTTNKDYKFWKEMEEEFGFTDQIAIGVTFNESVYTKENLRLIKDITDHLLYEVEIDEEDITALTTIDNIDGVDQELIIDKLIPEDEEITNSISREAQNKVQDNEMLKDKIVSKSEKSTIIVITVSSDISLNAELLESVMSNITTKLESIIKQRPDIHIYKSGMVSVKHISSEYMSKDMRLMFPIAILTVIIVLIFLLKSVTGFAMPLLVTLFSIVWTLGLKGWLNSPLTITETAIPVMLIAIGCADGVHIISEFLAFTRSGFNHKDAIKKTMNHLRIPVILTSITTSLGFFSLIVAPGVSIKNMGLFLGFGVITAMIFSLLFIPAVLSFKKDKLNKKNNTKPLLDLTRASNLIIKGRFFVIAFSFIILFVSVIGMFNIVVETDQVNFLKDNDPLKIATKMIQKELGGVNTLDIIFTGEEDSFKEPVNLKMIESLEKFTRDQKIVGYTLSLNDYIKKINYEFNEKDSNFNTIPNRSDVISNLLFLYEMGGGDTIDKVVNSDYSMTKLSIRLSDTSQVEIELLVKELDNWLDKNLPKELSYRYSNDYIRIVMGNLITKSQITSFVSTLIAILILLMIIFKSPLSGILTSLPVIIAVCFNFGIMWLTGTTLNIGTSIIASVGMGVGIDYAIHFFQRYKSIYLRINDNNRAIIQAINESSGPILTNALAVGIGFFTLLFSNYFVIAEIGWITGVSMLTTALCAIFILPAYLAVFEPLKKRKGENTMKKGLIALFLILSTSIFADEKGDEIMLKNHNLPEAVNSSSITTMVLIDKKGKKKTRKMESFTKDTEKGGNKYIEFMLPADVKGTKFLTLGDDNGDDDQRIYLPALKKVRKISSSNKKGKFMGSDITYYDMESKNFEDFTYTYLREESDESRDYWVIESISIKEDSPYGKTINYISKEDYFVYKREFFDKKDRHIKTLVNVETQVIDGIIFPVKTAVDNLKDKHKTLLALSDIKLNVPLDDSIFTVQNLK